MRIFVTGATGFLGYHFVLKAIEQDHEIMCLRRVSSIDKFPDSISSQIFWVYDNDDLKQHVNHFKPQVLFHAAWEGVRGRDRTSSEVQNANISMSKRLFSLYPYEQIIGLGSQAEYGYYTHRVSEYDDINPNTEYGKAKAECCALLKKHCTDKDIEWQWIRIFTIFGEKQNGGLISSFTNVCLSNERTFPTTEGEQKYSYLYSSDYAVALCRIIGAKGKSGIYNLSQPYEIHSNKAILECIKSMLNSNIKIEFGKIPYCENQIMLMDGNVDKFESNFGVIPHTDFLKALKSTVYSYMK